MLARELTAPLAEVSETELARLVRVADPLLAGRPLLSPGHRPTRGRPGQGVEFLDHQEYAPGDDLRTIDWRATARNRHPQIRRFRDERSADWFLCLDRSASMSTAAASKWRLAVQLAASLSYLLLHLGNRVGLMLFSSEVDQRLPLGRGHIQYARIARALAGSEPLVGGGGSSLRCCTGKLGTRNPVIVISDFLTEDGMQADLAGLLATGRTLHAVQVVDDAELRLTPGHSLSLRDVESRVRKTVDIVSQPHAGASLALQRLQDDLARYCCRHGIRYSACRSTDGWKKGVLRHLRGLEDGDA